MANRLVDVYRGEIVESSHFGHLAVVNSEGKLLYSLGDPQTITFLRSSAKPFQAVLVVESGAARKFNFTSEEIALIAGSHSGEPKHVKAVSSILKKIGLGSQNLQCGTHIPHLYAAKNITPEPGQEFSVLQHNCSGKHAGMLALAAFKSLPTENYLDFEHPVQQLITEAIAYICGYPEKQIKIGIDDCSAPVHALPLYNMACGFARLVSPHMVPHNKARAYSTVYQAMIDHPDMVGGEKRYDTELMTNCREKLIAKAGAEGLHCIGFPERGWGMAVKISDGAIRALYPFDLEALRQLGVVTAGELEKLKGFQQKVIKNWRGKEVGYIKAEFELEKKQDGKDIP